MYARVFTLRKGTSMSKEKYIAGIESFCKNFDSL